MSLNKEKTMRITFSRTKQIILLMLIMVLFISAYDFAESKKIRVIADNATIRVHPDFKSDLLRTATLDMILFSNEKVGEWHKVEIPGLRNIILFGYIHESLVEIVGTEAREPMIQTEPVPVKKYSPPIHYDQPKAKQPIPIMIGLNTSYYFPPDQVFKSIYGGGLYFSGEIAVGIFKNMDIWINGGFFSKKGEMTFSKEKTTLQIIPFGVGTTYRVPMGIFQFYGGLGVSYHLFEESSPLGETKKGGVGFEGRVGSLIKIIKFLSLDFSAKYTYCKIEPADISINIGGFRVGAGVAFNF